MSPRAAHPSSAVTARWYLFFRAMIPFFAPVASIASRIPSTSSQA